MTNKIKYGLKNVTVWPIETEIDGVTTYATTPIKVPGAVNLSISAEGSNDPFYADDIIYFSAFANNGYSGDLEIALVPEEFETGILGYTKDKNGAIIEKIDAKAKNFAMAFEFKGDVNATRHLLYKVAVSRPDLASHTKEDKIAPVTDKLQITATANAEGNIKTKLTKGQEGYDTFLSTVYKEVTEE
ncbi:major tail protein [Microaceticoccus formicicus]|uniref:major tail protein n=1 Tax=Microaceticoccus formicicus TaxID=3118105 RepID=UPI003CD010EE|nr:major tail protein [Peptoniphilaceae bacterium AMB_02]